MLKQSIRALLALALCVGLPSRAAAEPATWALTLAWSPQYCKSQGNPEEPQCENSSLFAPSGLIPQQVDADACNQNKPLSDTQVDRLMSVTQNARQARETWRRVGGCAGLPFEEFATQFDYASRRVAIPEAYADVGKRVVVPAAEIRQQFIDANPGLSNEGIALHCKGGELVDAAFCLTAKMKFTDCGKQTVDDCGARKIQLRAPGR